MSYGVYNGPSEGFEVAVDGYIDYAREVIARRAMPDVRDGLKPVERRIIYGSTLLKDKGFKASGTIVGEILKSHPHGDQSIYGTFCSMTDRCGAKNVPFFIAQGNTGRVYSSSPPAAMRYTEADLNSNIKDFFRDHEAIEWMPREKGKGEEPKVLPIRYPIGLINGTTGMAVSVSTGIPSFNFWEVVDLTIKSIKSELTTDDIILPDFPTGGVLVKDDETLAKIMLTGKGKLKVRAKVDIAGKNIYVMEVPTGKTVEGICTAIEKCNIPEIKRVTNAVEGRSTIKVDIECRSKNAVEYVLVELYRRGILQSTFSSNIIMIEDDKPLFLGVHQVIDKWLAWRRERCNVLFSSKLEKLRKDMKQLTYLIRLLENVENKDKYTATVIKKGRKKGREFLKEIFEDIQEDECTWISKRGLDIFHDGGEYKERYAAMKENENYYQWALGNIDDYIISDLENLKKEKKGLFERRTEVTTKDYKFSKISDAGLEDDSYCVYSLTSDGFLKKTRDFLEDEDIVLSIEACANSTLIGFDTYGRLLRIYGSDVPYLDRKSRGFYLPAYLGIDSDAVSKFKYSIKWLGLMDGREYMLLFSDGYASFIDSSEFIGKKRTKVVSNGVPMHVQGSLSEVIDVNDFPEWLAVADDTQEYYRFSFIKVSDILRKSRTARTKVFNGKDVAIGYYAGMSYMDVLSYVKNAMNFVGKLKMVKYQDDIFGELDVFQDCRYYGDSIGEIVIEE